MSQRLPKVDNKGRIWTYYEVHGRYYPFQPCEVGNPRFGRVGQECDLSDQKPCVNCGKLCCQSCSMFEVDQNTGNPDSMASFAFKYFKGKVGRVCIFCWREMEESIRSRI